MAVPRDPAFWKRFSTAVHLDEEAAQNPEFKQQHQSSWLVRQQRKSSRRTWVCYGFWFSFLVFVAAIVIVVIWLVKNGYFGQSTDGEGDGQGDASTD